jgi:hypothetical protein
MAISAEYEFVHKRIKRFNRDHEDGRIITINHTCNEDRQRGEWIIEARVYLSTGDQAAELPKCTGWAFERDGGGGAAKLTALQKAETAARGRALAVLYGSDKPSYEEMQGVRFVKNDSVDWAKRIGELKTKEEARALYTEANRANASRETKLLIQEAGLHLDQ